MLGPDFGVQRGCVARFFHLFSLFLCRARRGVMSPAFPHGKRRAFGAKKRVKVARVVVVAFRNSSIGRFCCRFDNIYLSLSLCVCSRLHVCVCVCVFLAMTRIRWHKRRMKVLDTMISVAISFVNYRLVVVTAAFD